MPIKIGNTVVYTVEETSHLIGVSERTLRVYLRRGILHGVKVGGLWRITESELEAFLSGRGGTSEEKPQRPLPKKGKSKKRGDKRRGYNEKR